MTGQWEVEARQDDRGGEKQKEKFLRKSKRTQDLNPGSATPGTSLCRHDYDAMVQVGFPLGVTLRRAYIVTNLKKKKKRKEEEVTDYPTLPYPTLPYPTLPYPTLPYPTLPYPTLPYPTLPTLLRDWTAPRSASCTLHASHHFHSQHYTTAVMEDKRRSDTFKSPSNLLLSGARGGFSLDDIGSGALLVPVTENSPAVLTSGLVNTRMRASGVWHRFFHQWDCLIC
ncbi:RNA-binding protein 12 [Frankliniella fusca]|uniref:RNA-binding protein 12 n=1 Tax=Frankliniella fusca TaxID=407009 RepID=A0AAE1HIL4_9NEOP|nr:RNA-binding protein 12 [Frankliniella fusca]